MRARAGDRVYLEDAVIDLATGKKTPLRADFPPCERLAPWRDAIVCVGTSVTSGAKGAVLSVVRADGSVDVVADTDKLEPYSWVEIAGVAGDVAWTIDRNHPQNVVGFDLAKHQLVGAFTRPQCEGDAIVRKNGCKIHNP
jgi:hypothetical protein